jgi:hypothetical protein
MTFDASAPDQPGGFMASVPGIEASDIERVFRQEYGRAVAEVAVALTDNAPVRQFLERRLAALSRRLHQV